MLDHDAEAFCRFSSIIGQALVVLQTNQMPDSVSLISNLKQLDAAAQRLELNSVHQQIERIREASLKGGLSFSDLRAMFVQLYERLSDGMKERVFLSIGLRDQYFYEQPEPLFGRTVQDKFPSLIYDIEEAGKCLALDRSTACAFHSIRSLEAAIGAMSRCLGIPDPTKGSERSWMKLLTAIKIQIDQRWPASSGRMAGDAKLFDEAYGALSGMQNPYRNSTMHLADKYTSDEA
ncbi:MAG: hypothetical protein ABIN69_00010, partial [Aestuariivirga sp.]